MRRNWQVPAVGTTLANAILILCLFNKGVSFDLNFRSLYHNLFYKEHYIAPKWWHRLFCQGMHTQIYYMYIFWYKKTCLYPPLHQFISALRFHALANGNVNEFHTGWQAGKFSVFCMDRWSRCLTSWRRSISACGWENSFRHLSVSVILFRSLG